MKYEKKKEKIIRGKWRFLQPQEVLSEFLLILTLEPTTYFEEEL